MDFSTSQHDSQEFQSETNLYTPRFGKEIELDELLEVRW